MGRTGGRSLGLPWVEFSGISIKEKDVVDTLGPSEVKRKAVKKLVQMHIDCNTEYRDERERERERKTLPNLKTPPCSIHLQS